MIDTSISAFANTNRIPTTKGWKNVGSLTCNDRLFGHNGQPVKIRHLRHITSLGMQITMSDGREYICSEYARLDKHTTSNDAMNYLRTRRNHGQLPSAFYAKPPSAICYSQIKTPIHPYLMGALAASHVDQKQDRILLTNLKNYMVKELLTYLPHDQFMTATTSDSITIYIRQSRGLDSLKTLYHGSLELLNRYIHRDFMSNNIAARAELLAGLIDTTGKPLTGCLRLSGLTTTIRIDAKELAYSLGIPAIEAKDETIRLFSSDLPTHREIFQAQINQIVPKGDSGLIRIHAIKNLGYTKSTQIMLDAKDPGFLIENYLPVMAQT